MHEMGESTAEIFARYQQTPTGQMRMVQAQENLAHLHDLSRPLRILDAGGGNGLNSDWLLQRGHAVTLLDPDPEMIEQARRRLERTDTSQHCQLVLGTVEQITEIFADDRFDLIICHHVLEYVRDPLQVMTDLREVAALDGELSLITLNPVSEVLRAIVFRKDGKLALSKLTDLTYDAKWFGAARLYPLNQVLDWSVRAGWDAQDFRAIRVLADYIPDDEYSDAKIREVTALEEQLSGQEPYRRMGRYLQCCFKRRTLSGEG
jgi:S-adenosylmethionine-dependent methyltransferase